MVTGVANHCAFHFLSIEEDSHPNFKARECMICGVTSKTFRTNDTPNISHMNQITKPNDGINGYFTLSSCIIELHYTLSEKFKKVNSSTCNFLHFKQTFSQISLMCVHPS